MRHLILSDIHGNLSALEAVLAHAGPVDEIWCLGDLVDYGPDPEACVARMRRLGAYCVAGNHDHDVLAGRPGDGWTHTRLSPASRAYLTDLPESRRVAGATLRHTFALELRPPGPEDLAGGPAELCLVGHTHVPLLYRQRDGREERWLSPPLGQPVPVGPGRAIANPGSVGLSFLEPRAAAYLIYETAGGDHGTLTWSAAPYSAEEVAARLRAVGAPPSAVSGQEAYLAGTLPVVTEVRAAHAAWASQPVAGAPMPGG